MSQTIFKCGVPSVNYQLCDCCKQRKYFSILWDIPFNAVVFIYQLMRPKGALVEIF